MTEVRAVGHKILVSCREPEEKTAGGIILPDQHRDRVKYSSHVGRVIELGPEAYKDRERFPSGPWCQEGDWVVFAKYEGVKISLKDGLELRLLNDDQIVAVIDDPDALAAA